VYICTYIHKYVPYIGRPTRRNTCVPVITGSVSLEMRVMEQVARMSSNCRPASGRITRVRASTMASVLSWSSGGWTVWMRMRRSHIWGVGPDRECRLLADAGGDDYQLERIESRWFHAPGNISPGTWGRGAPYVYVRRRDTPTWGYESQMFYSIDGWWHWVYVTMRVKVYLCTLV